MSKEVVLRKEKQIDLGKVMRLLPLYIIISFLGSFFTLWLIFGSNPNSSLRYYLFSNKIEITYDTYAIKLDSSLPEDYVTHIKDSLSDIEYNEIKRFEFVSEDEDFKISLSSNTQDYIFKEDLIPVTHLYSLTDDLDYSRLVDNEVFVLDSVQEAFLEELLNINVVVEDSLESLVSKLSEDDSYVGFVTFNNLEPDLKTLFIDEGYYLDDTSACISMYFGIESSNADNTYIYSILNKNITRELNIEEVEQDLLAKVNMTGVTAISRVLAKKVDASGDYEYPAEYIGDFLADADLTHTSNEVSFVDGCAVYSGMRFCSNPEYMAALLKSGIDVVELTGNHNNDFGATYSASSIDMYVDAGIRYFGGGLDTEDAAEILYEEVEGTTIAFIGYNYYDTMLGTGAIASDSRSGANSYSVSKMESNIAEAKENADIVIVDFQFQECWSYPDTNRIYPVCYEPLSSPDQKGVFRMAVDFGADIVVGTQAHQPQTFELYDDGVIFYGLGNLYFDQTNWIGTRQGMVLTHYFYSGEYIQTKITPIYMNDNLQPEFATEAQGDLLMELLKDAR